MAIYQPAEDSYLLQKFIPEYAFGRVLDVGTGSGIQALTAAKAKNVREVVAVDINEEAVKKLKVDSEVKLTKKIKAKKSNLFSNVENQFNLIIFNPPYLPQDKGIEDPALYGGKQGWEISARFFSEVSKYLFADGKILFLFSSLTNKEKIEEIIAQNLFDFKELAKEKQPLFEELYVYLVEKSKLLRELERKGLEEINYFTHGKRGDIFTAISDRNKLVKTHLPSKKDLVKLAIKVKRTESVALERMQNEAKWLKILNKEGIGPRFLFSGEDYLVYRFVEGEFILDWAKGKKPEQVKTVLGKVLEQCFILDQLGVNKEEMHHPLKHIIVKGLKPVLIDFERCSKTEKPHNVTQFVEFICRMGLGDREKLRELAQQYKEDLCANKLKELRLSL